MVSSNYVFLVSTSLRVVGTTIIIADIGAPAHIAFIDNSAQLVYILDTTNYILLTYQINLSTGLNLVSNKTLTLKGAMAGTNGAAVVNDYSQVVVYANNHLWLIDVASQKIVANKKTSSLNGCMVVSYNNTVFLYPNVEVVVGGVHHVYLVNVADLSLTKYDLEVCNCNKSRSRLQTLVLSYSSSMNGYFFSGVYEIHNETTGAITTMATIFKLNGKKFQNSTAVPVLCNNATQNPISWTQGAVVGGQYYGAYACTLPQVNGQNAWQSTYFSFDFQNNQILKKVYC